MRLAGDRSGTPAPVPRASRWQLGVQGSQGVSFPLASRPWASPGTAYGSQVRPAFRFLFQGLRDLGRRLRHCALQTHPERGCPVRGCREWGLHPGRASDKRGSVCMCVCVRGSAWVPEQGAVGAATKSRPGLRTVARGGARANSRSAAAGRAQPDTGKACDWAPLAPMQTS